MNPKSEYLVDLIFKKLKTYNKKIFLEKENLNKFILSLFKEKWMQDVFNLTAIVKLIFLNKYILDMDNFSSLTIILAIIFIVSLYFLFSVNSNTKN